MYSQDYALTAKNQTKLPILVLFFIFALMLMQGAFASTKRHTKHAKSAKSAMTASVAPAPVAATSGIPDDSTPADRFYNQPDLFGSWSKAPALERLGIAPSVTLTSDIQGNPGGGMSHGFKQFSNLFAGMHIELEKLMGAPGTEFYISLSERFGNSLTRANIGNAFNVAQVCCGTTYRVVDVYLEQPLFDNHLNVRAGRIAAGDEFLSSPLYWYFVQNGIDGNPVGIFKNTTGMTAYPTATWGARVRFSPIKEFDVMAGAFNGDSTLGQNNKHGLDWSRRGPGFYLAELGYHYDRGKENGLPGNYKLGAYYDNAIVNNFLYDDAGGIAPTTGLPPETRRGTKGYYVLLDQMVYRKNCGKTPQGITPFISYLVAPNAAYNAMPYFLNAGVVYQGPFDAREKDVAGLALVYGSFSNTQREAQRIASPTSPTQNFESVIEAFYLFQVTRWLKVQPDLQYVINPNGTGNIPNATVVGAQLGLTL